MEQEFKVTLWSDNLYQAREVYGGVNLNNMSEDEIREYVAAHRDEILEDWDNEWVHNFAAVGLGEDGERLTVSDDDGNEADLWDWFDGCYQHYRVGKYYKDWDNEISKAVLEDEDDPTSVTLETAADYHTKPGVKVYCVSKYMSEMVCNCTVELPEDEEFDPENITFEGVMLPTLIDIPDAQTFQNIKYIWYNDIECDFYMDGPDLQDMGIVVVSIAEDGTEKIIYSDIEE